MLKFSSLFHQNDVAGNIHDFTVNSYALSIRAKRFLFLINHCKLNVLSFRHLWFFSAYAFSSYFTYRLMSIYLGKNQ